jgi:hypothetical protein
MVKVSPGSKMVSSGIDWETHSALSNVPVTGVPLVMVACGLGEALASWVGVEVNMRVAVRLGEGVAEGVKARSRVTWANTVAATSVRRGFKSRVGVLVGVEVPQAVKPSRLRITAIATSIFNGCVI